MQQNRIHEAASSAGPDQVPGVPWWAVLLSTLAGFLTPLAFGLLAPRPALFPPLIGAAPDAPTVVQHALVFSLVVGLASLLAARLAGASGALAAGLMLSFNWTALLVLPLAPYATLLAFLLLLVTLLFMSGARAFPLALAGLTLLAALLVVPVARESSLGQLWRVPVDLDWERLVFWRAHSALASPLPLLGAGSLIAIALASLLALRSRREGSIIAGMLLVSFLAMRLVSGGQALLSYVLALLAVLGGVWAAAIWRSLRSSRWRAFAVLIIPALFLVALGARVSTVDAEKMSELELELRLERVAELRAAYRTAETGEDMDWAREHFPEDRRVRLAEAEQLLAEKRYREAARAFKLLRREYPEWRDSLMGAGWADFFNETYPTAEMHFREILAEEPDNARALVGLGACAIYNSKDYQEAERLLTEGLAIDESIAEGHHNMVLLLIKTRALYESEEQLMRVRHHARRCMELDPTNDDMRRFARRSGWAELIPEDEASTRPVPREERRP